MASTALQELLLGLEEISALRAFPPRRSYAGASAASLRAAGIGHRRACTVLLCSHYERFIYSLNEQATDALNQFGLFSETVPVKIRLLQSRQAVINLAQKQWDQRDSELSDFVSAYGHMWTGGVPVTSLDPQPHLESMKSPKVRDVLKFFQLFGIEDIFAAITRSEGGKRRLTRGIQSLVDSRNGIAHGDRNVQPGRTELTQYMHAVRDFCSRSDRALAVRLGEMAAASSPW